MTDERLEVVDEILRSAEVGDSRTLASRVLDALDARRCPDCDDLGWVLTGHHAGRGNDSGAITLNLTACYYPTCKAKPSPRPIATLGLLGMFSHVVRHPGDGTITAVDGFTGAVWR